MNRHASTHRAESPMPRHAKRTRLQALLFTGAAFGTLVTLGAVTEPKFHHSSASDQRRTAYRRHGNGPAWKQ